MSKAPKPSKVELKNEELTFGVDEAVEVLVVKYLSNVKPKVEAAEEAVRVAVEAHEAGVESVIESVDTDSYNHTSKTLGIKSVVRDVIVRLNKTVEDSSIRIVLALTDLDIVGDGGYTPEIGKYRSIPMTKTNHKKLTTLRDAVHSAQSEANRVDALLDTSDVRRSLRARVMTVKLREAGIDIEELLNDEDVSAIINV
jgi:hypothetical protein